MSRDGAGRGTVLLAGLVLAGCGEHWRTEMWYQPAIAAGQAPRSAPEHSLALGSGAWPKDRAQAGSLINPSEAGAARLARGKAIFAGRCVSCHGAAGHGDGPMSKLFPPTPDLSRPTSRARNDGYFFGMVLFGGQAMPATGAGLTVDDLWAVVDHARVLSEARGGSSR